MVIPSQDDPIHIARDIRKLQNILNDGTYNFRDGERPLTDDVRKKIEDHIDVLYEKLEAPKINIEVTLPNAQ